MVVARNALCSDCESRGGAGIECKGTLCMRIVNSWKVREGRSRRWIRARGLKLQKEREKEEREGATFALSDGQIPILAGRDMNAHRHPYLHRLP